MHDDEHPSNVDMELQDYLDAKGVNTMFIKIVENLLVDKPDNPAYYIAEYLKREYPDQMRAGDGSKGLSGQRNQDEHDDDEEEDDDDVTASDDESGGSNSERDDRVSEIADKAIPKSRTRRAGTSAEPMNPFMVDTSFEAKVYPKTDEEAARILSFIKKNILFSHLDQKQLNTIKDAMFPVRYQQNDVIIFQGDDGDNFYVVEEGECDVYVKDDGQMDQKVASCKPGDSFGELALMYNAPRAATVKAVSPEVLLWAVDRSTFKMILMDTSIRQRAERIGFLRKVPILASLTEAELLLMADSLTERSMDSGEVVVRQGERGDKFYIVQEGVAVCSQMNEAGVEVEVAQLPAGAYFGEIALLTPKPRQASVYAQERLRLLVLDRKTFKRVMGPLQDILNRNLQAYTTLVAANI